MKVKEKREKKEYTLGLKKEICLFKAKNKKATLAEIGTHFKNIKKIDLPVSTISGILKSADDIVHSTANSNQIRKRH